MLSREHRQKKAVGSEQQVNVLAQLAYPTEIKCYLARAVLLLRCVAVTARLLFDRRGPRSLDDKRPSKN